MCRKIIAEEIEGKSGDGRQLLCLYPIMFRPAPPMAKAKPKLPAKS